MAITLNLTDSEKERFWATVKKSDGCWICEACPSEIYPRLYFSGKKWAAHIISYIISNGQIDDGKLVCHSCDTPRCVRPDHLSAMTQSENMREMVNRRRNKSKRGELNPMAKITDSNALQIRETISSGQMTPQDWSSKLGTSDVAIYKCLRGETFPHIGGPRIKSEFRKLFDSEICEMRWMAAHGYNNKSIALKFGIHQAECSNYVHGKRRPDLPGAIPPRVPKPKPIHNPRVIKFTPEIIQDIRDSRRAGAMLKEIAAKYNTRIDTIQAIISGKRGKSVPVGKRVINQNPCKHPPEVQQEILRRNQAGETQRALAREYGMSKNGINLMLQRLSA